MLRIKYLRRLEGDTRKDKINITIRETLSASLFQGSECLTTDHDVAGQIPALPQIFNCEDNWVAT